jgi:plastocyanin
VGGNPNSGQVEPSIMTSQSAASQDIPSSVVARKGVQEVSVIASDLGYFPKTIFVSRDVPVRMFVTSSSKNTLCIMMDSFQVRRQVKSQKIEEITFVPNVPGKYRFYCPVNGMEGSLVVRELSSSFASQDEAPAPQAAPAPAPVSRRVPASGSMSGDGVVPSVSAEWHSAIDNGNAE